MIHLQRKIKARFAGSVDYLPEGIPTDKFLPVIGYEARRREYRKNPEDKPEIKEDVYYMVTNDHGRLIPIASFNMVTMIDEKAEIDINRAMELLRNITIMGQVISEKMGNYTAGDSPSNNEKENGESTGNAH